LSSEKVIYVAWIVFKDMLRIACSETTTWERKGALKYAVWTYQDARVGSVHRKHLEKSLD